MSNKNVFTSELDQTRPDSRVAVTTEATEVTDTGADQTSAGHLYIINNYLTDAEN